MFGSDSGKPTHGCRGGIPNQLHSSSRISNPSRRIRTSPRRRSGPVTCGRPAFRRTLSASSWGPIGKFSHALQEDGILAADLRSSFFQHIVIGALREIPGFSDAVYETLDANSFSAASRASIASALGRGLDEASEDPGSPFQSLATGLFREYWTRHVNQVGGNDGAALATYVEWLDKLQLPPMEIASLIEASLVQAPSWWQVREVLNYLQRYLDADPAGALRLLHHCVEWWRLNGNVWGRQRRRE